MSIPEELQGMFNRMDRITTEFEDIFHSKTKNNINKLRDLINDEELVILLRDVLVCLTIIDKAETDLSIELYLFLFNVIRKKQEEISKLPMKTNIPEKSTIRFCISLLLHRFMTTMDVNECEIVGTITDNCPICYEDKDLQTLVCRHSFCFECLKKFLVSANHNCPLCRFNVASTLHF